MMNREQAIAYGKHIGVRWHIYNSNGCLVGGTKTLEQAQAMKRRFEIEERSNPWTHGTTRFEIREATRASKTPTESSACALKSTPS